jgi:putative PIG3 family NAD(P)H quinone oxidoreductase
MRAICIREPGGPEVLELRELPDPLPGPGEIRVKVHATALNRADLLQRRGLYPAPPDSPADIPGLEFAGVVEVLGPRASRFKVGDKVMGVVGGGAYAERLVLHERAAVRSPAGMDLTQAAAIPEAYFTAFDALILQAGLRSGERLLIHAVGSGVGTAAVQVARLIGARTLGTARSEEKLRKAQRLGLETAIVAREPKFAEEVKKATGGAGVDVVLDLVGGAYLEENVRALAPRGRQVVVGLVAGTSAPLNLGALLAKRLEIRGTVLRSRPLEEKIAVAQAFERQILPALDSGALRPVVDEVMPMAEVQQAHRRMESNETFGKLVLVW